MFSLFITSSVGGICHSPVDGGNELCIPGSSSQNILKPLLTEFEVGMATPIPPFLAEKRWQDNYKNYFSLQSIIKYSAHIKNPALFEVKITSVLTCLCTGSYKSLVVNKPENKIMKMFCLQHPKRV